MAKIVNDEKDKLKTKVFTMAQDVESDSKLESDYDLSLFASSKLTVNAPNLMQFGYATLKI